MMGSVRGTDDELLFEELQNLVKIKNLSVYLTINLKNHVTLFKNLPYD